MGDSVGLVDAVKRFAGMEGPEAPPQKTPEPVELFARVAQYELRKSGLRRKWKQADAYYEGMHWVDWSESYQSYVRPPKKRRDTQAVINLYQSYVSTLVSMLCGSEPIPSATPRSDSPLDGQRAQHANALLRHKWKEANVQDATEGVTLGGVLHGNGFFKVYWETGDKIGQPIVDPESNKIVGYTGRCCVEAVSAYCVGWNDTVAFDRSPWVYQQSVYTPEDIYSKFGVEVEPDAFPEDTAYGGIARMDGGSKGSNPPGVGVVEWWERPGPKRVNGLHMICTKNKVLYEGPLAVENPWPMYHFGMDKSSAGPWYRTPFGDAIPLSQALDRVVSDILDAIPAAMYPGMLRKKDQTLKMDRAPGAIGEWDGPVGATPPQQINNQKIEAWTVGVPDLIQKWLELVTGLPAMMLGQAPFSRASARALGALQEQTTKRFANVAVRLSRCLCDVGVAMLELHRMYGPMEECVAVAGDDGRLTTIRVMRDGFGYQNLDLDPSEVNATSKWAMMEQMERWLQYKAIDPKQFQQALRQLHPQLKLLDPDRLDKAWATRNLEQIKAGVVPTAKSPMNFAVHFETTAEYAKTAEWLEGDWPAEAIQAMDAHLAQLQGLIAPSAPPVGPDGAVQGAATTTPGTPGPTPSPGLQGVAPELNGGLNPPGVNQAEEGSIAGM